MNNENIIKNYLAILNINYEIKNLEDITKLIKAHLRTFAFSSLKVLLKEEISLDLESIYENVVVKKRGAYCFEHNKLMFEVLKHLGFDVTFYLARVINNTDNQAAQTHRFTLLQYKDEKYLIDVGFGFRTPSVPVKFSNEASISHLDIPYKIIQLEDNTYSMQLIQKGKTFNATKFDLNKCYEIDFEMGHFYSHKNPSAMFVNNLVISLIKDSCINTLVNNKYLKIFKNKTEEIEIKNIEQLEQILKNDFNCNFTLSEINIFWNKICAK